MNKLKKTIVLIGFKNTGKSTIGKALSEYLKIDFIDLDRRVEENYHACNGVFLNSRQISAKNGIEYFRNFETQTLKSLSFIEPFILSVGGGAVLSDENQAYLSSEIIVKINCPKGVTFERIMLTGRPAFFPEHEDPYTAFSKIWEEREPIYNRLANFSIDNSRSIQDSVNQIIDHLRKEALL